jgi:hypothetical protein
MTPRFFSLLFVLLLILPVLPASAGDVTTDVGAGMVSSGIDMFFDSTGKSLSGSSNSSSNITASTLSGWYNPFDNPVVRKTNTILSIFAFTIFIAYVLLAMCYLVIQTKKPEAAQALEFAFNSGKSFNLQKFVTNCFSTLGLFVFTIVIIIFLLSLAQAASNMMDTSALITIHNSSQSGFVKFIYGMFNWAIEILLDLRNLILTMICSFTIVLIFLWKFPIATKPVEIIGIYLVLIIFMQPVMVGTAAIGIETIDYMKESGSIAGGTLGQSTISLALLILLIVIAAMFIIGPFYFHKIFFSLR